MGSSSGEGDRVREQGRYRTAFGFGTDPTAGDELEDPEEHVKCVPTYVAKELAIPFASRQHRNALKALGM